MFVAISISVLLILADGKGCQCPLVDVRAASPFHAVVCPCLVTVSVAVRSQRLWRQLWPEGSWLPDQTNTHTVTLLDSMRYWLLQLCIIWVKQILANPISQETYNTDNNFIIILNEAWSTAKTMFSVILQVQCQRQMPLCDCLNATVHTCVLPL